MSDVFISYSRQNSDFARRLTDKLRQSGKESWVDWVGIPQSSPNWWNEIKTGIEQGDSFIFIMSPDSMASVVCNMELDYALDLKKRIIPVVYQDVISKDAFASIADYQPDEAMKERLQGEDILAIARDNWQRINHINWLFFRPSDDFDSAYRNLITTVETDVEYVKAHTRYLSRAKEWEQKGKRVDLLLFGEEIDLAEGWLDFSEKYVRQAQARTGDQKFDVVNPLPDDLHRMYLAASRNADKNRKRVTRVAQVSIITLFIALMIGGMIASGIVRETEVQVEKASISNTESALLRENAQTFADSLRLAARAQDIYDNGLPFLGLRLAYEASLIDNSPQVQRILGDLAYTRGARQINEGHTGFVSSVAFSPDEQTMISASYDKSLILWDVSTGDIIRRFEGHEAWIFDVAFSPDGKTVASAANEKQIILWDVQTGKIRKRLEGHRGAAYTLAFHPNGREIFSGGFDNIIIRWNILTGEIIQRYEGHTEMITDLTISREWRYFVSSSYDGWIFVWDMETGEIFRKLISTDEPPYPRIFSIALDPEDQFLVSGTESGDVTLWYVPDARVMWQAKGYTSGGHSGGVNSAVISWQAMATASDDGEIILWDIRSGSILHRYRGHVGGISSLFLSRDQTELLSGSHDATIMLWDVRSGDQAASNLSSTNSAPNDLIIHLEPDGTLALFDVETNDILHWYKGHTGEINSVIFSPDNQNILTGSEDSTLILWNISTGTMVRRFTGHSDAISTMAFSRKGDTILSGSVNGEVFLWDVTTGNRVQQFKGHDAFIQGLAFSSDNKLIMSGSNDSFAILWDVATGEMVHRLGGHSSAVTSVAFSPDGHSVLTGSADASVILWDVETGDVIRRYDFPALSVSDVWYSEDGQILFARTGETVVAWRNDSIEQLQEWVRNNRYMPELTCEQRNTYGLDVCNAGTAPPSPSFAPTLAPLPTQTNMSSIVLTVSTHEPMLWEQMVQTNTQQANYAVTRTAIIITARASASPSSTPESGG